MPCCKTPEITNQNKRALVSTKTNVSGKKTILENDLIPRHYNQDEVDILDMLIQFVDRLTRYAYTAPFTLGPRNLKRQQSLAILDLCLKRTRSGRSLNYPDAIVYGKLRFQNAFRPHQNEKPEFSNSSGLIFE